MAYLEWKEPNQSFLERLAMAEEGNKFEPNCYSTAFFLLGIVPYDIVMYTPGRIEKALSRMIKLRKVGY